MAAPILVTHSADGIATVCFNRAQQRHTLTAEVIEALTVFAQSHRAQANLRAVVLTGGPSFFSAGFDLSALPPPGPPTPETALRLRAAVGAGSEMCRAWEAIEAPTLAAIEGYCVGGALALALACDVRIAAASARLRLPEVPLGMPMGWGALPRLTALVGPARAKRLTWLGQPVPAAEAAAWGLVDEITADGQAQATAQALAAQLAALPVLPVRSVKAAVNACVAQAGAATAGAEADVWLASWSHRGSNGLGG